MAHWREHIGSPLLGAYSLYDDEKEDFIEKQGLILGVRHADYILGETGKQNIFVADTSLGKPIKINVTISQAIAFIAGTQTAEKWVNIPVVFYVDKKVKRGKSFVEAIRVKGVVGKESNFLKIIDADIAKLNQCKTLNELQTVYLALESKADARTIKVKDELKNLLK